MGSNYKPTFTNEKSNIIAGPNTSPQIDKMQYWNHSPGLKKPVEREEQPFPIQGNIGSLIRVEANSNWAECGGKYDISGSPNCTGNFVADPFTLSNTCGDQCVVGAPESFGDQDFGFQENSDKFTNSHGLHAYQNVRAGAEGQMAKTGCYEFVPGIGAKNGVCAPDANPVYTQVGDWTKLQSSPFNKI